MPAWVVENLRTSASWPSGTPKCAAAPWSAWVAGILDGADLALVDTAPDPGNEGHELRLYDQPAE